MDLLRYDWISGGFRYVRAQNELPYLILLANRCLDSVTITLIYLLNVMSTLVILPGELNGFLIRPMLPPIARLQLDPCPSIRISRC